MKKEIKSKSIIVNNLKVKKNDSGEEKIVFVASSNRTDRSNETVDVKSLRLPLKGGGEVSVGAMTAEGLSDVIDIPLMLNHSRDVTDTIGSVKKAYLQNDELVFEASISSREIAQEMLTLIKEEHLSNAFSITMSDFDYNFDTGVISNAEIIEVSLVYRGCNREARLLAVKSLMEGELMQEKEKQNDVHGLATGDGVDHNPGAESAEQESVTNESADENQEVNEPEPDNSEPSDANENSNEKEEEKMKDEERKKIAMDGVANKAIQPVQKTTNDYLKTKEALVDFKNTILKFKRGSNEEIMKSWMENLKSKGVTGDAILPARIESIFFKAWEDNPGVLGTFRFIAVRSMAVYAMSTESTAQGHKKGDTKDRQTLTSVRRDLKGIGIYKMLELDLQDLYDDETGELLAFRVEELASRVANAIVVGAIFGQGTGDKATKQGNRGLFPMISEISSTDAFSKVVATKLAPVADETMYDKAVRVLGAVEDGENKGKVLIAPKGFKTQLALARDKNGALLLPMGMKLEDMLGVTAIYELPEMEGKDVSLIAYQNQSYVLNGEASATTRIDYDLNKNQDIMLLERYVAGSAQGYKTLAGITKA